MQLKKLPKLIRFLLICISVNLLAFTVYRIIFWEVFNVPNDAIPFSILLKSFYLGLKFDMRLALLIHLPVLLLAWIKPIDIFRTTFGRWLWSSFLILANTLVLLFYFTDFGHYEYLENRLDATALRFLYNPKESFHMILESYPVFWGVVIFAVLMLTYAFTLKWTLSKIRRSQTKDAGKLKKMAAVSFFVIIYAFGIYGKFSYYPLQWSDAFFSTHEFASAIVFNPVLYFFDTYQTKDIKYDLKEVQKYYETVASFLEITNRNKKTLNFIRNSSITNNRGRKPNVIMVFLESFAYYKTGISGNPLDPTPNFDKLAKASFLFKRFYIPQQGTARSIFTAVTGIPDIGINKTSSRNPKVVKQHTIINAFEGYEKYYFLGGSANWGQIRGILSHNVPGLHIFEEGSYSSPRVDVWGISDLHLFEEANRVFRNIDKPFFAIIQTSGHHKPYTIPYDNRGFQSLSPNKKNIWLYGFKSIEELNSFRFMDHSLGVFMESAKREDYFNNTLFVFFGDHGVSGNAMHMHQSERQLRLMKYHVPLVFYSPSLIKKGEIFEKVASEVDLLPSIAHMTGIPYVNSTFGRDLFDNRYDTQRYAFVLRQKKEPEIGLIGDKFLLLTDASGTNTRLHQIYSQTPTTNVIDDFPEVATELKQLCHGIYETAKYMRYHNTPEIVAAKTQALKKLNRNNSNE